MKPDRIANRLWPILYEDDDLLAVAKPWGVDTGTLSAEHRDGVVEILRALRGSGETLEPANRLSRYESGVLLLGKNDAIVDHIRTGLRSQRIAQEYVVVVQGRMTTKQVTVGGEHGASRGRKPTRPRSTAATKPAPTIEATTVSALQHGPKRTLVAIRTVAPTTHALKAQLRAVRLRALGDVTQNQGKGKVSHQMACLHLARIAFHHPVLKRKITVSCRPPDMFRIVAEGGRDVTRALFAALARRATVVADREVEACRLLTGAAEDLPKLIVDQIGNVVVIEAQTARDQMRLDLRELARWYRDAVHAETVVARWNVKSSDASERGAPIASDEVEHILGRPLSESLTVRERALKFIVNPGQARSVGLFADHRDNRERVRAMAHGKDVLNLFAYTCGFSLAAGVGRSASTVSVDLAGKHLEWGRKNFALNGIDTERHEFVQGDSVEYLRRALRQERAFDLIIIDPPSFAHGRKRGQDFSVARDLTALVADALAVLRPGGVMMVSTNLRKMSHAGLRERVRAASKGRRCRVLDSPPLPPDFAVDPDHAKTVFFEFA